MKAKERLEQGKCPNCGQIALDYGDNKHYSANQVAYDFTCENCGFKGQEWFSLVFAGMTTANERGEQEAIEEQDESSEEKRVKSAVQANTKDANREDWEIAAEILHQVGEAAEAEDLLSTEEREEHDKAVLEDIVDWQGIDGVASMLKDICHLKAEHLSSNQQDETSAATWERCAEELDSFVGWYYGLGD